MRRIGPSGSPADLLRAGAWPDGRELPIEREETHVSVVLLRDEVALKVKKAVRFPFLDYSTAAARRAACEAEVALNRRLAPEVYRGVIDVRVDDAGRWTLVGDGPIVDAAVLMQRMPVEASFASRLEQGRLGGRELALLADRIAEFHAAANHGVDIDAFATPAAILANAEANFVEAEPAATALLGRDAAHDARERLRAFLRDHEEKLLARISNGRIRDGHGDLRLEHVYLLGEREIVVLDCVEFSDRYRCGDVASDVAFLAMDLAWHGAPACAERWLAEYARASSDFDLYGVVDLYGAYRAWVRAKIEIANGRSERARKYLLLALAEVSAPIETPRIIVVMGAIAAGKSTVAARIGARRCVPVIGADPIRKRMHGVPQPERIGSGEPFQGAYDPGATERVYGELLRCAEVVLRSGRSVVLDATFRTAALREGPTGRTRRSRTSCCSSRRPSPRTARETCSSPTPGSSRADPPKRKGKITRSGVCDGPRRIQSSSSSSSSAPPSASSAPSPSSPPNIRSSPAASARFSSSVSRASGWRRT